MFKVWDVYRATIYTYYQLPTLPTQKQMNIRKELLDKLLKDCKDTPDLFGVGEILKQLRVLY